MKTMILLLLAVLCSCNEDGNPAGSITFAEILDGKGLPDWRPQCGTEHGKTTLLAVVGRVPQDGRVLEILTCDTILVRMRGRCFLVTQGYHSHSWTQATCPPAEAGQ